MQHPQENGAVAHLTGSASPRHWPIIVANDPGVNDSRVLVPTRRFELLHLAALAPQASVSTSSTTSAISYSFTAPAALPAPARACPAMAQSAPLQAAPARSVPCWLPVRRDDPALNPGRYAPCVHP